MDARAQEEAAPSPEMEEAEDEEHQDPTEADPFGDVLFEIDVQVGRTVMKVRDILKLSPNSTITLDRPAHEPVVLTIQDIPIGQAEVVGSERGSNVHVTEIGFEE